MGAWEGGAKVNFVHMSGEDKLLPTQVFQGQQLPPIFAQFGA